MSTFKKMMESQELGITDTKKELNPPAKVVKSSLLNNLNNIYEEKIEQLHKLCGYFTAMDDGCQQLNDKKIHLIDGFVGVGKSLESLKLTIINMLKGNYVIYGVHTISSQLSRSEELETLLNQYINVCSDDELKSALTLLLDRIVRVSSIEKDSDSSVTSMFENTLYDIEQKDSVAGACVFVCNQAVRLLNCSAINKERSVIFFDDDNSSINKRDVLRDYKLESVKSFLSFFNTTVIEKDDKDTVLKIESLKDNHKQQLENLKIVNQAFYEKVKPVIEIYNRQRNNDLILFVSKNDNKRYDVILSTKLSIKLAESFSKVYAVSENVMNDNLAIFDWINNSKVGYDYSLLKYDSVNRGEKFLKVDGELQFKIATVAGKNTFRIAKAINKVTENSVSKKITRYINSLPECYDNVHVALNKRSTGIFDSSLKREFTETGIDTRGRNDLMDCNVSLLFGINTIRNNDKAFYKKVYKMDDQQVFDNVTIAPIMQNLGRTAIRKTQVKPYLVIFPDLNIAKLCLERLAKYYPDVFTSTVIEKLINEADHLCEDDFNESNQQYSDLGLDNKHYVALNRLRSKHGAENVDNMILKLNGEVLTVIEYFKNVEQQEKELNKSVSDVARKVRNKIKSTVVKQAAEKIGKMEFINQCNELKNDKIIELVNNINNDVESKVDEIIVPIQPEVNDVDSIEPELLEILLDEDNREYKQPCTSAIMNVDWYSPEQKKELSDLAFIKEATKSFIY
ncbi:hypothetical protein DS891_07090 [Pseudoalteromonas sp. JC28]|uniref:hypothetical protein n=1 Tax=Pseudoalteromonas sp. JC28 TaxID=2267617 RepID=UPI001574AFD2|nr:hypothetical protein [Pseudoalteromonas sp. JC28]NSY33363.1 hypothetical protein [Pseudoalteromonas sp. JC28]